MKQLNKALVIAAATVFTIAAHGYNDPQTDYDSLYGLESEPAATVEQEIDIAVFETETIDSDDLSNTVDPQTDYDSLHQ